MSFSITHRAIFTGQGGSWFGYNRALVIAEKVRTSFLEHLERCETEPPIKDFAIFLSEQQTLIKQIERRHTLIDQFSYSHETYPDNPEKINRVRSPDPGLMVIDFSYNSPGSDVPKWRVRNAFAKVIDDSGHPNCYTLHTKLISFHAQGTLFRPENEDIVFSHGELYGRIPLLDCSGGGIPFRAKNGLHCIIPYHGKIPVPKKTIEVIKSITKII